MKKTLFSIAMLLGIQETALALPSFARQTGLPCGSCHSDFPQLTPLGRQFKLGGYTMGAANNTAKGYWVPPVSVMAVESFTHTEAPQDNTGTDLKTNDNFLLQTVSVFYGGAITEHIGAFAQGTYNAPGYGPAPEFNVSWDNTDIRYANTAKVCDTSFIYGLTINNNPTVQDVWNTTPAWGFPFVSSSLASTPAAGPIIDGAFAASVAGVGIYTFIDNLFYIEATGYQTLGQSTQKTLGIDPTQTPGLFKNIAPYFRLAAEPHWGNNSLQVGAFGLYAEVEPQPWSINDIGSDAYFDLGFDSQYQYQAPKYIVTLRNSIIMESQDLDASYPNGLAANPTNYLTTFNSQASFVYGDNFRLPITLGYFNIRGTEDELLYTDSANFSPDSSGWTAELGFIPFGMNKAPIWPWFNARLAIQYTWYDKFNGASDNYDGMGTDASDNNTTFVYLWVAM